MKRILTLIGAIFMAYSAIAQAPERMTYQAVVRNAQNEIVANQGVSVEVSITQTAVSGVVVFAERHSPSTNTNGLFTIYIGAGSPLSGSLDSIDWSQGPYFLNSNVDPTGGNNFSITSTTQLVSVPYALYAKNTDNWFLDGDTTKTSNFVSIENLSSNGDADFHLEATNFADFIISNIGSGDPNIWLRDVDSSVTWRIHNDQSRENILSIRPWTDYSGFGGTALMGLNNDPLSINTSGRVSVGNGVNFKETFNVYHPDSAFVNIETSGNNKAGLVISELGGARGARIYVDGAVSNNLIFQVKDDNEEYVDVMHMPFFPGSQVGHVGIGTDSPTRKLHVNDVMRLEPRATPPSSPQMGDIYMNSTSRKLFVFDGISWQPCW